ncbi:aspartyl-phosphate phosphatase Spo0E family protein [Clostridium kluyveri]|uniref:Uncharacterized protein n=1 Tax=Clostridium kluyveri (strain ATCC 8527 / DSM 555 / NBRC 12016 / NCIMB 10680 / K1) TaxID=431943 RepID=A5F9P7_CLOK5|nr:aspartyl-phosphate phosphatase Spo0E family protein [Clostridium kluyveri]ABQ23620.1 hypothetical protein CKL_4021 [Clostridium kluyveri DSM 555]
MSIEAIRDTLYKHIDLYGLQDERTLRVSRRLNKLIAKQMKEKRQNAGKICIEIWVDNGVNIKVRSEADGKLYQYRI